MPQADQKDKDVIRLMAEVIAGTAVLRSMGVLAAAEAPWDELRRRLHLFGYSTADEVEAELRTVVRVFV